MYHLDKLCYIRRNILCYIRRNMQIFKSEILFMLVCHLIGCANLWMTCYLVGAVLIPESISIIYHLLYFDDYCSKLCSCCEDIDEKL